MRIAPLVVWSLDGDPAEAIDARLLPLLRAIAESQSLAAAVAHCGVSYRAAWGLLRDYERRLGEPLVLLERGRGASLASAGEKLIAAERAAARRLLHILPTLAVDIGAAPRSEKRAPAQQLRIAASHDLALAALANALPASAALLLVLSFMGSLYALREFATRAEPMSQASMCRSPDNRRGSSRLFYAACARSETDWYASSIASRG